MQKTSLRCLSFALCLVMLVGLLPLSALAVNYDPNATNGYYTIISKQDYVLCEGATESEIILNNEDGTRRQIVHVMEVDPNSSVEILPSYYEIDKDLTDSDNWTAQIMEVQMDYYRDTLGYNVVGGMNTALAYDNEAPCSFMVYNGKVLADNTVHPNCQTYLAVTKDADGNVNCELRSTSEKLHGDEWQAVSCNFGFVVQDGKLVTTTEDHSSTPADRSMIGIKEDGTLVICQVEGRNAPVAVGLTNYELGEVMLSLGCKWAVNGDGGGSSQFLTKREGESDYSLRNNPSDGSPRPTINGIIIASTAEATGKFDHLSMIADSQYITPGSSVSITLKGVDPSGAAADIPEGITYVASAGTYENGVYTADNTAGTKTITAYLNGEKVGSVSLEVVIPTSLKFNSAEITVPFGKTVDIGLLAYYGAFEVPLKASDVTITLSNTQIGTLSGFNFSAVAEGTLLEDYTGKLSAVLNFDETVKAETNIALGKGSQILYDFEDQNLHGFIRSTKSGYNYNCPNGETYIVDASTGHVHDGKYAMAVGVDYSNTLEAGFILATLNTGEDIVLENAKSIGMWIYIPDEAIGLRIDSGIDGFSGYWTIANCGEAEMTEVGFAYAIEESGWYYISKDISSADNLTIKAGTQLLKFYVCQKDGKNDYTYGEQSSVNGEYTFYVDSITVDYSAAVDDREPPVFGGLNYAASGMDESKPLNGNTVTSNTVSFTASVSENTKKSNHTGIDTASGKFYIDGIDRSDLLTWNGNSKMIVNNVTLSSGTHTIKFSVCDKQGNYSSIIRTIVIQSVKDAAVQVLPRDPNADRILLGSLYYLDIVADNPETISKVTTVLDLNNISVWELDHMTVANGFSASYTLIEDENIATITITQTGNTTLSGGDQVIASIPVRTWEMEPVVAITGHVGKVWMYPDYKNGNEILPMDVKVEIDSIVVEYKNGKTDSWTGSTIQVDTELSGNAYTSSGSAGMNYIRDEAWYASWNGGHDHRDYTAQYYAEGTTNHVTATAIEDKTPTCTEAGYTGRTVCPECGSIVNWGTTLPATGHSYYISGNHIVCDCGDQLTSTGVVKLGNDLYYLINGTLMTGWQMTEYGWSYFDSTTKAALIGDVTISGLTFHFDGNGAVAHDILVTDSNGTKCYYGPNFYKREWVQLDGATYYFGEDGYMFIGWRSIPVNRNNLNEGTYWYDFGSDGKYVGKITDYTGFLSENGKTYYVVNGANAYGGLMKVNGDYYYARTHGELVAGKKYWITKTNDLLPAAYYTFDENGKMVDAPVIEEPDTPVTPDPEKKNGIVEENGKKYWYVDDVKTYGGLMLIDGDYYYARSSGEILCNTKYWITKTNDLLPAAYYTFGADGKMIDAPVIEEPDTPVTPDPEKKNGIVEENGKKYWYVDDVKTYGGLMLIDGDYYYARSSGEILCNTKYWITKTNDLLPAAYYTFGADGKMIDAPVIEEPDTPATPDPEKKNGIVEENGKKYWYVDDVKTYGGLMLIDGDYYYARSSGEILCNTKYWITKTNDLLPAAYYTFDADGKMVTD